MKSAVTTVYVLCGLLGYVDFIERLWYTVFIIGFGSEYFVQLMNRKGQVYDRVSAVPSYWRAMTACFI